MNVTGDQGYLEHYQDQHIYQPSQPQKLVIRSMVREFVNRVFNGSAEPLLAHLVEDQHLTEGDLNEIRRTIKAARKPK